MILNQKVFGIPPLFLTDMIYWNSSLNGCDVTFYVRYLFLNIVAMGIQVRLSDVEGQEGNMFVCPFMEKKSEGSVSRYFRILIYSFGIKT